MRAYDPRRVLVSVHLPKSGGTTFRPALQAWFGRGLHLHYFIEQHRRRPTKIRLRKGLFRLRRKPNMCVHGFFNRDRGAGVFDYYPGANQFITMIRDPLEQHLSHFFYLRNKCGRGEHYWEGKQRDFAFAHVDEFLEKQTAYMLRYFPWQLTFDNFKWYIDKYFVHVGVTEMMQHSVDVLAERLGKPRMQVRRTNITPRDERPSAEAAARFKERHALEYAIYSYALELNR